MANYYASIRTNYFRVKDEKKFREFIAHVSGTEDRVELWEEKDKNGKGIIKSVRSLLHFMSNGDLFSEMSADMTVKDLLNFPSGLYTSGDLVIMRQEGVGFLIMEETHHNWVELRRYDEAGLLTEVTYERA